jgi:hypothetical protein
MGLGGQEGSDPPLAEVFDKSGPNLPKWEHEPWKGQCSSSPSKTVPVRS